MMSLRDDLLIGLDPVRWAAACGFPTLDPWQQAILHRMPRRGLWNCARQSGKSQLAALMALHTAIYQPGALVLLVSRSQRQSGLLFDKVSAAYHALGASALPADTETALELHLGNDSIVAAIPGREETVRGFSSVRLLVLDESAWIPDSLYRSLLPMLALSGGSIIALSTPNGRRGWWYQAIGDAKQGLGGWEYVEVPASQCPRLSPQELAEQKRQLGPTWYASEFECVFNDPEGTLFRTEDVLGALEDYPQWTLSQYLKIPPSPIRP